MSLLTHLVGFGLRQVIGDAGGDAGACIVGVVEQRFRDHSQSLPKALDRAHHRAWQALGIALAGDGLFDRVVGFFASGDDKGIREQVHVFLKSNAVSFNGTPAEFRQECLAELQHLRKSGLLTTQGGSVAVIARQADGFKRHTNPHELIEEARVAVNGVADALAVDYPKLSRLLRTPTPDGPPLLAAAFCYFFRREVETDDELAHGLFFDGLRQLSASQAKAFGEAGKALTSLGDQFDAVFESLARIETKVVETHAVAVETQRTVLAMQAELQRLPQRGFDEMRSLFDQVLTHLNRAGMQQGEIRPGNSCSIRGEDERRAVKALLARFRQIPPTEQGKVPALLNGLGKLQMGTGDFAEARQTFAQVAQIVGDSSGKAAASYNAHRAALEEKKWDAALTALRAASLHDPQRFAPFPLHRYEPSRILGAGGFGTAILCRDRHFDEDVVVKTLHAADLARGVDDVFREARILRQLSHPAIIRVRDCEYADPTQKARPYLVMDHFPGVPLQDIVDERGPLNLEDMLAVAVQVAEGMKAAHAQGVLHRDLKPTNILVCKEANRWEVKIIDFGLALRAQTIETSKDPIAGSQKSTLEGSVAGTLDYAPPEQLGKRPGVQPGPYSDVYAFARTYCYALFQATELLRQQWAGMPGPLADLLEGCLNPDPMKRSQSFESVLVALHCCSGEDLKRQEQEKQQREEESRLFLQRQAQEQQDARQRMVVKVAVIGGIVAVCLIAFVVWFANLEPEQSNTQQQSNPLPYDRVTSVAFSSDSKRIVSASGNKVKVWDAETGKELMLFPHNNSVDFAQFSPDDKHVVGCSSQTVKVWDAQTGQEILSFQAHTDFVRKVEYSSDGKRIASLGQDNLIKVWDADTGKELLTFKGDTSDVVDMVFSPDGKRIATADRNHLIHVWDAQTGTQLFSLNGHTDIVWSVAFSADGTHIVSGSGDKSVKVWDAQTGKEVLSVVAHTEYVLSVTFSPDGKRIVSGGGAYLMPGEVRVWDAQTGQQLFDLVGHSQSVSSVAWSPDSKRIASVSRYDGEAKVWDAQSGQELLSTNGR